MVNSIGSLLLASDDSKILLVLVSESEEELSIDGNSSLKLSPVLDCSGPNRAFEEEGSEKTQSALAAMVAINKKTMK